MDDGYNIIGFKSAVKELVRITKMGNYYRIYILHTPKHNSIIVNEYADRNGNNKYTAPLGESPDDYFMEEITEAFDNAYAEGRSVTACLKYALTDYFNLPWYHRFYGENKFRSIL